jgi:2,3-bisphosphoglycerate-independent phosphoglycerate mutase
LKSLVLIVDGAAGWPVETLGGRTSLESAFTPNLDRLATEGVVGRTRTVPDAMEPSSAIACMSVFGFDPALYYAGRGPIEATALGIDLEPGQAALRCNLVTVCAGKMRSYACGHITSADSHPLVRSLQEELGSERVRFHPGVGFRHVLTVRDGVELMETEIRPLLHSFRAVPVPLFSWS